MANSERQQQMTYVMDETDKIAFRLFCENIHLDHKEEKPDQEFIDSFLGTYKSFQDFVIYTFESIYEVPEFVSHYVDYESMANDWEASGEYWYETVGKDCYVFGASL